MDKSDKESCPVSGTLAMVLQISKYHGAAPLHLKPRGDGYIARASKPGSCTWILLALIIGTIGVGLVMDLHVFGTHTAIRVKTTSALIVWLSDLGTLFAIAVIGVIQGETRMKKTLKILKGIEKISEDIGYKYKNPRDSLFGILFIALLIYAYVIVFIDYGVYVLDAYVNKRQMAVVCLYCLLYSGYILTLLLIMQVTFVILAIYATVKSINIALQRLIDLLKAQDKKPTQIKNSLPRVSVIPLATYTNKWIDQLDDDSARDSIRRLSDSYILLYKVVGNFNDDNGLLLLMLLASYIGYTFITNYYLIRDICLPDLINKWMYVTRILIPVVWTVLRFIEILAMIESFHRTHDEMSTTQVLLSKAIYIMTPAGQRMCTELDTFCKQILLYKPSFSPLSICSLQRSQLAAIIAGIVTYMIIIMQYHLIEECKE